MERHGVVVCAISSGGKFRAREPGTIELPYSNDEHDWHVAGPGVQLLIRIDIPSLRNVITDFFGFDHDTKALQPGKFNGNSLYCGF